MVSSIEEDGAAKAPQVARHHPQPPGQRPAGAAGGGGESTPRGAGGRCSGTGGMGDGVVVISWG